MRRWATINNNTMINTDVALAIKEEELDDTILELQKCVDRIKIVFDKINNQVDSIPNCIKSTSNKSIAEKYALIKANYNTIINNMNSYSTDLVNLKFKVKDGLSDVAQLFATGTDELKNMERRVDINGS